MVVTGTAIAVYPSLGVVVGGDGGTTCVRLEWRWEKTEGRKAPAAYRGTG